MDSGEEQNAVIALNMADRAYVLETGRCTLEGEAKDILLNEHVKKRLIWASHRERRWISHNALHGRSDACQSIR
jgi:ABC-type glutathione transport system ATPase component